MREILFKAKRMDNGEWVEGYIMSMCHKLHIINPENEHTAYEILDNTICQFTGLYDKNGKRIWENDILQYSYDYPDSPWLKAKGLSNADIKYHTGQVFWSDWRGSWAVCGKGTSRMTNNDVFTYSRNPNRVEVIGNIFDNPELLKKRVLLGDEVK